MKIKTASLGLQNWLVIGVRCIVLLMTEIGAELLIRKSKGVESPIRGHPL